MDVKEVMEGVAKVPASTANAAAGAAGSVIELASKPARTVRRLEKKGRSVNRKVATQVRQVARPAAAVLDGSLPERWLIAGVRIVKRQARRRDLVGLVARRGIGTVHAGLEVAVRSLSRLERATQPPARPGNPISTQAAAKASASRPRRAASRRRPAGTRSRTRNSA